MERIHDYMNGPRIANGISEKFRTNGAFPHGMDSRDRDTYLVFGYSMIQEFKFDMLYFGLEDGTFLGYGNGWGTYREPVNSGYQYNDTSQQLYYNACVNRETGVDENCTMNSGDKYIQCVRDCGLMKCADDETQACSAALGAGFDVEASGSDYAHCSRTNAVKWCRQYAIEEVQEGETLGFVPRTYHCHDELGKFTQQPGRAVKEGFLEDRYSPKLKLGDCEYENKLTKVERFQVAPYVYCNGGICSNTFDGGYRSRDYDPRYRGWYIQTKEMQMPNWSPPYPFFSKLDLGITYSHPMYSHDEEAGRYIFEGVFAVDYTFEDISSFLVEGYKDSEIKVVVYEEGEPNYIVASSTGRKAASKVLEEDPSQPCPDVEGEQSSNICIVVRDRMQNLQGYPVDDLLVRAYEEQKDNDYPRELLTVKGSEEGGDEQLYVVQSSYYRPGGDLNWIVLVISPAGEGTADSVTKEDPLFGVVCVVASMGFFLCLAMFYMFYRQRHERAVILADWRFTSAFLLGCALLNLSTFTLLGENTDALCMLRMWSFHFLFALALSPLFVKVWRMWRMVGAPNRQPAIVNHSAAVMLSLPIIVMQVLILTIFTLADPPKSEEIIDIEDGIVTQRVVCTQESIAFTIVMMVFEAGLLLIGCVLAYVTRNLDTQFGEAKQLMFSMYNISFIGIITTIIIYTMNIDATGQIILTAIGIFWGTFFSSAAFVLPRLLRVKEEKKMSSGSIMKKPKSQKSPATSAQAHKPSRVRFSMDDDSSIHSDEQNKSTIDTASNATDKKSNISKSSKTNGPEQKLDTKARAMGTKDDSFKMPSKNSNVSNGMGDDSFLLRGTGWSVYESSDPNALLGRWSSANEKSDEFNDEGFETVKEEEEEEQDGTARTASDEDSPSNLAMSTIEEDVSDSSCYEESQSQRSSDDKA